MTWNARLFGTDGQEISDVTSWFEHAPPEKGAAQWKDGYSAKEQAKAWCNSGSPTVPAELYDAVVQLSLVDVDEVFGRPEHQTSLDKLGRARQHDMFACARHGGATQFVVGIEAKACEGFDGRVADRAGAEPPSRKRARCNLLSSALFGRPVLDERTGEILDPELAQHGYQLWTAAVGTIIEAQRRGMDDAVVVVHQFTPASLDRVPADDRRDWARALASNASQFDGFAAAIREAGSVSHQTEFVKPGTRLHTLKVESLLQPLPDSASHPPQ